MAWYYPKCKPGQVPKTYAEEVAAAHTAALEIERSMGVKEQAAERERHADAREERIKR
jgi:hypothetical protein